MDKKSVGNKLEELVVSFIRPIEPQARRTKNSGGSVELEDILSTNFMVQCKVDNTHENIIINKKDWDKMINALPINTKRTPIFVNQQKDGLVTVTMLIGDYFETVYKAFKGTGEV
jgi:hypothetical protein